MAAKPHHCRARSEHPHPCCAVVTTSTTLFPTPPGKPLRKQCAPNSLQRGQWQLSTEGEGQNAGSDKVCSDNMNVSLSSPLYQAIVHMEGDNKLIGTAKGVQSVTELNGDTITNVSVKERSNGWNSIVYSYLQGSGPTKPAKMLGTSERYWRHACACTWPLQPKLVSGQAPKAVLPYSLTQKAFFETPVGISDQSFMQLRHVLTQPDIHVCGWAWHFHREVQQTNPS